MSLKLLTVAVGFWILIPTFTPDDVITYFIISKIGFTLYLMLIVLLVAYLYSYDIKTKSLTRELKQLKNKIKRFFN